MAHNGKDAKSGTMTTQYKITAQAAALQKEIDQYLANTLARNQALRDRLADLAAKAEALKAKQKR